MAILLLEENLDHPSRYPNSYLRVSTKQLLWLDPSKLTAEEWTKMSRMLSRSDIEVYVEQRRATYKPKGPYLFWFKTLSLTEKEFVISQRLDDDPKERRLLCWGDVKKNGTTLTLRNCDFTALMFANVNSAEGIVLLLKKTSEFMKTHEPGVSIAICNKEESLEKVVQNLSTRQLNFRDRISKPLKDGRSILASIEKGMEKGVKRYLVEVQIDPEGSLPWPDPEPACIDA
jgi:hypothetical protein